MKCLSRVNYTYTMKKLYENHRLGRHSVEMKSIPTLKINIYGTWPNRFQGFNSASLCSLASRYDNPTQCLVPIDRLKIPAQASIRLAGHKVHFI